MGLELKKHQNLQLPEGGRELESPALPLLTLPRLEIGGVSIHTYHSLGAVKYRTVDDIPALAQPLLRRIAPTRLAIERQILEQSDCVIATSPQEMADLPLTPVECLEMLVAETGVRGYLLSGDTLLLTDGQFFKCPPIGTCHPKTKKGILRELHIKNEPVMLN